MKKILVTFLLSLISLLGFSQSLFYDTTFSNGPQNMQAKVWLPPTYYTNPTDSFELIIMFPGLGEYSTSSTTPTEVYGPMAYKLRGGWDGSVVLGNGTHYPIYVTVIRNNSSFLGSPFRNTVIENIVNRYRAKRRAVHITGLSEGGWGAALAATYQPSANNYSRLSVITSFTNIQGVKPEDTYGATPPYATRFRYFALYGNGGLGGKSINFQQALDGRDVFTIRDTMNAAVPGSSHAQQTNFGSGGHTDFDKWYGNYNAPIDTFTIFGKQQNTYQAILRMGDTTFTTGTSDMVVNAGVDKVLYLPLSFVEIRGTASEAGRTITGYSWTKISGPDSSTFLTHKVKNVATNLTDTLWVNNLVSGTYTFRLTATNDLGETGFDDVVVNVNANYACNVATPVTYQISATQPGQIYHVDGSSQGWKGGDTLEIAAGTYSVILFGNVGGDQCKPLYIRPAGNVIITGQLRFNNYSHHIIFDGKMANGQRAVQMQSSASNLSNNITIKNINVGPNPGGVGIYFKQDPDSTKPTTWYQSYTIKKITIDSNYINNVEGEGMYIGNTAPNADPYHGNLIPIRLDSITISNNIVDSTGWDGIQLSCARDGNKIFGNVVTNFGLNNFDSQRSAYIMGGNTSGDVYNNIAKNGTGNGIQIFGYGTINIYGNTIDSVGNTTVPEQSMYGLAAKNLVEDNPMLQLNIYNNIIRNPKSTGAMDFRNPTSGIQNLLVANVYNNTFCIPGATGTWQTTYLKFDNGWTGSNNILDCGITPPEGDCNCFKGLFRF